MNIAWFATFRHPSAIISESDLAVAADIARSVRGVTQALLFTPADSQDPYLNDGPPPPLIVQLKFPTIESLEAALHSGVCEIAGLQSLRGAEISEQAMVARCFAVPEPVFGNAPDVLSGTYLVAYEGEADDTNVWLSHYIKHHPPIMARFPGIREIEIYTRMDWCSDTSWRRENAMQRNKVVFDSPDALTAALNSPVRHEMRADFAQFPPFTGKNSHFPMWTHKIL